MKDNQENSSEVRKTEENPELPETLWHYTTMEGLLGILSTNLPVLRATNILYLNDSSEYGHARDMIRELINERLKPLKEKLEMGKSLSSSNSSGMLKAVIGGDNWFETIKEKSEKGALELVENILKVTDPKKFRTPYILSFSENKDQLSQWRGYCPDGGGLCIGFQRLGLYSTADENEFDGTAQCVYDEEEQIGITLKIIESFVKIYRTDYEKGKDPEYKENESFNKPIASLIIEMSRMKHCSFAEEKEWRLLKIYFKEREEMECVHYRRGKSMLIPYIEVPFDVKIIKEIIIGPTPHPELAARSVKELLRKHGNEKCVVKDSNIPYRSW